eukprot:753197-Pelagomonas_calceolata.AAC.2
MSTHDTHTDTHTHTSWAPPLPAPACPSAASAPGHHYLHASPAVSQTLPPPHLLCRIPSHPCPLSLRPHSSLSRALPLPLPSLHPPPLAPLRHRRRRCERPCAAACAGAALGPCAPQASAA